MSENRFSRRYFFYGSLLAGAVPAGGFGSQPSLKALGFKSFNEKLNIANVGAGTRGSQILPGAAASENIVAVCDVNEVKSARVFGMYPKATRYKDFRKMLDTEGKNIDAVMVATPDHLHTAVSLRCMQHGKHVYCEKPLTRTVWEAQLLADAAVKYKVATQMGNQGFNHEGTKTACEIVWSGDIGEVREVHSWTGGGAGDRHYPNSGPPEQPVPPTLDWDMWLGPAAPRPYNADMIGPWRSFLDFSAGGTLGDWLVHCLGPAHLALQLDKAPLTSVEAVNVVERNGVNWPASDEVVFEFPARGNMPPVTIHAYQAMRGDFKNPPGMGENDRLLPPSGNLATDKNRPFVDGGDGTLLVGDALDEHGQRAPRPAPAGRGAGRAGGGRGGPGGTADRGPGNGTVFVGSKGCMATVGRGEGVWLLPASTWADYKLPPQLLPRGVNHQQDWIRACKGGAPGVSDFAVTTKYIQWLILGAVALRVPGKLMWDAKNMRFSNNEEANKYIKPYLRKGWELKL
jgi:hypothetical protein